MASEVACEARHARPVGRFRWRLESGPNGEGDIILENETSPEIEEEQGGFFHVKEVRGVCGIIFRVSLIYATTVQHL